MKANTERNWSIRFWGAKDDFYSTEMRGTIEAAFARADEAESEVEWEIITATITCEGRG